MTVREHMALAIAGATYTRSGRRETDALELVGYSGPRFWQVVDALLDRADVEAEYPQTVRRLQRVRAARLRARVPR